MAVLAIAGIGAAIGAGGAYAAGFAGMALLQAGAIGFSIGAVAGNMLFPPKGATVEGSRLGDLSVTASTYGVVRPIAFGNVRVSGNLIWGTPIQETRNSQTVGGGGKGGGGKGGGGGTQVTYTYSSTFALGLCQGPATGIVRIWMNGSLVYDTSTGADTVQKVGLTFRFYPGDEDQLPDSLIEADKGAGNVPAFRGLCYLVFDSLPLADYGNRIPNIQAEVAFGATRDTSSASLTPPNVFARYDGSAIAIDPLTLRGYVWGTSPTGIAEFDLTTMTVLGEHPLGDIMGDPAWNSAGILYINGLWIGFDRQLYALMNDRFLKINPVTFRGGQIISAGSDDNVGGPFAGNKAYFAGPIGMEGPAGIESYFLAGGGNMGHVILFDFPGRPKLSPSGAIVAICPGKSGTMSGTAYVLSLNGPSLFLDRVAIECHADIGLLDYSFVRSAGIANVFTLDVAFLDPAAERWHTAGGLIYDPTDDSVIFEGRLWKGGLSDVYLVKWSASGGFVWALKIPNGGDPDAGQGAMGSDIRGGRYAHMWGHHVVYIDTASGAILDDTIWPHGNGGQQVFSGTANCILTPFISGNTWEKVNIGRLIPSPPSLGQVFSKICTLAGMSGGDFDVSGIEGITLDGFAVSQRTSAADILKPLAALYQVDAVESDDKIRFLPRGGSIAATISEDQLVRGGKSNNQTPDPYVETRAQEISLPSRFTISYIDETANFQVNTQMAKRVRAPTPTVFSDQQIDLQAGVVMTADAAARQAEKLLFSAWLERHTFKLSLPPDFVFLNPADPVRLTLNSGYTMRGRLGPVELGADSSIVTTIIAESDGQYVSVAAGADAAGNVVRPIANPVPTNLFLLDVPLLRDTDDTAAVGIRAYWAGAPYADLAWSGAQLQASADREALQGLAISTAMAAWGNLETALPDVLSAFRIFTEDSIVVRMVTGEDTLASVTETQLANGLNAAAVFKANGEIEIVQFLTVTALGNHRYRLTGLNRGARGTDTMGAGHAPGETIVMLRTATVDPILLPLSALNATGWYRAVSTGTLPSEAIVEQQVFHGRDLMPYAPVNVAAARSGGDIVLNWNRRARVNGGLIDGTGAVPVGEQSERYEIDIFDAGGTAVLRTLTAASQTAIYSAANTTADFGTAPAVLKVKVFQMSAAVGRGFARLDTLKVT